MTRSPIRTDDGPPAGRRLAAALVVLAVIDRRLRSDRPGRVEIRVFRALNRRPDSWPPAAAAVTGAGHPVVVPLAAALAAACGQPRPAARVLVAGLLARSGARLSKRGYRRPRPAQLLAGVVCRGRPAWGYGYVSSHTAVAVTVSACLYPALPRAGRAAVVALPALVGLSRLHAGAHLPLDVLGGAALGVAAEACAELLLQPTGRRPVR